MDFEPAGHIIDIETIAAGRGIRDLEQLRRLYGSRYWRKMKGSARIRLRNGRIRLPEIHWYGAHGFGKKSSSAKGTSTRRKAVATERRFAVCVCNEGYGASLERNKIYAVLPGDEAERDGDLRVIDESGEDYLFSTDRFVAIDVPAVVRDSLLRSS